MLKIAHARRSSSALALAAAIGMAPLAQAQDTAASPPRAVPAPAPQDDAEVQQQGAPTSTDEIVVTGTSIRGAPPVGSSLIQLGRDQIESTPSVSTTDILREIPQIFNFGVTDAARSQSGGASNIGYGNSINIRGIGPYATLTLLNGRRPVPQGTIAASVDPGNIPAIALQRIEVIADGASAIYGSDAVAGVANLILRRDYDGLGVDVQYGDGADFNSFNINAIFGTEWASGRMMIAGQHNYRSALSGADRDFYRSDLTALGGSDYRVNQCNPGNIIVGGASYAIPEGGASPTNLVRGTSNLCDNLLVTDLLPQQETNSVVATLDQDITDGVSFFADAMYSRRDGARRSATAVANLTVPSTNAFFVAPLGAALPLCAASVGVPAGTRCETVAFSFEGEPGAVNLTDIKSESWQVTGGFDVDLPADFQMNVYATWGENTDDVNSAGGTLNNANLAAALRSSNPAAAFNPFGTTANSAAVLDPILDNLTYTFGETRLFDAGVKVDGSLFTLPGGEVRAAIGGEYYDLKLRTGQLRGPAANMTGPDQTLGRDVKSAYIELLVPIFGPGNAIPGFRSLEIDLAGRIDDYSDVGTTKNPKIGINWSPVEDLQFHGSYGESFRAPLLTQITSSGGSQIYVQNYFDPTVGTVIRGSTLSGGNLDLVPETARTWSAGVDYTPGFLPGGQLTVNYFDLVYEGQVTSNLSNLNILRQEALYQSIILRGAAATTAIADLLAAGFNVANSSPAEAAAAPVFVDGRTNNLGTTITRGIDFTASIPWDTDAGNFRFGVQGTKFFTYKVALTPGGQINQQINNIDYPLEFRARGSVAYENGPFQGNIFVNYTNGYNNTYASPAQRIDSQTTVDLTLRYDLAQVMDFGGKQMQLGLNITNVFDKDPPFVNLAPTNNGGGGFDPTVASPLGRVVAVSLRTRL